MLLRQSLKVRAHFVQLIDFAQDCLKRHRYTAPSLETPKVGELQMDWLSSGDLKEEKVITTPPHYITPADDLLVQVPFFGTKF
jgi:hypothetical protein